MVPAAAGVEEAPGWVSRDGRTQHRLWEATNMGGRAVAQEDGLREPQRAPGEDPSPGERWRAAQGPGGSAQRASRGPVRGQF